MATSFRRLLSLRTERPRVSPWKLFVLQRGMPGSRSSSLLCLLMQRTLGDGRAEAVFPLTITPEHLPLFDFSDPFLVTGGALFVRAPNSTPQGLGSLADKIVVTPRTGPLAAYIQKNAPELKLVITKDYEESLSRLVRGEADVAVLGFHVGISIASRLYPGQVTLPQNMFTELPFAVAVAKGQRAQFLIQLNAGIAAIRADG